MARKNIAGINQDMLSHWMKSTAESSDDQKCNLSILIVKKAVIAFMSQNFSRILMMEISDEGGERRCEKDKSQLKLVLDILLYLFSSSSFFLNCEFEFDQGKATVNDVIFVFPLRRNTTLDPRGVLCRILETFEEKVQDAFWYRFIQEAQGQGQCDSIR